METGFYTCLQFQNLLGQGYLNFNGTAVFSLYIGGVLFHLHMQSLILGSTVVRETFL